MSSASVWSMIDVTHIIPNGQKRKITTAVLHHQQRSGPNAVMYSTKSLSRINPINIKTNFRILSFRPLKHFIFI